MLPLVSFLNIKTVLELLSMRKAKDVTQYTQLAARKRSPNRKGYSPEDQCFSNISPPKNNSFCHYCSSHLSHKCPTHLNRECPHPFKPWIPHLPLCFDFALHVCAESFHMISTDVPAGVGSPPLDKQLSLVPRCSKNRLGTRLQTTSKWIAPTDNMRPNLDVDCSSHLWVEGLCSLCSIQTVYFHRLLIVSIHQLCLHACNDSHIHYLSQPLWFASCYWGAI